MSRAAIITLHRAVPARSFSELEAGSRRCGPIQRAAAHVAKCRSCWRLAWHRNVLCRTGTTLAQRIPRRPARRRA